MAADTYYILTRVEPAAGGKTANSRTRQCNWRTQRNNAPAIIHMECSNKLLPQMTNTTDCAEM